MTRRAVRLRAVVVACLSLMACSDPPQGAEGRAATSQVAIADSVEPTEPPAGPPSSAGSEAPDPFSVPASGEALAAPPQVRCTLASLTAKIAKNKTAGFPNIECEWKSAEQRFWGRKTPTAELSVALYPGADVARVAKEMRITRWEESREDPNLYSFSFASTDDAINAIRPLICHTQVIGASMVLLINAQDDEELDAWCEDQIRARPAQ